MLSKSVWACALFLSRQLLAATPATPLAVGDWVFRLGTSAESHLIAQFGSGEFSHIGMVVTVQPEVRVLHATTSDSEQQPNQVIVSSWDEFTSPRLARSYAVARPEFLSTAQNRRISQRVQQQLGQPFVLAAQHNPHLYCTTLLAEAIRNEIPEFQLEWSYLDQPLLRGYYLHPDAFVRQDVRWVIRQERK